MDVSIIIVNYNTCKLLQECLESIYRHTQGIDFEVIVSASEFEALVLECNLIKQHTPKYNILLKDDKGYHYIKVTDDSWPKIKAVMQKEKDKAEYIGPYYSFYVARETVDEVHRLFKLPDCNRSFDKYSKPSSIYEIYEKAGVIP